MNLKESSITQKGSRVKLDGMVDDSQWFTGHALGVTREAKDPRR